MKIRPEVVYIEFDSGTPIPPDQIVLITQPNGWLVVKVASNQKQIEGGFTIRGRMIALNTRLMETKQIKETLAGLGLSKQEVEIILGAVKGVKIAPLAYSEINAMTDEVLELKAFKDRAQQAVATLGLASDASKKERKPRSDKGTTKTPPAPEQPAKVEEAPEMEASKGGEDKTVKKGPTPRKVKASDADKGKKESAEEIKSNVANLGGDDEIPL